jgi:hypothetical protein
MLDPLFSCERVRFGLLIPLSVPAVELRFILKLFFSITLGEDPACWSPCSLHNELSFGLFIQLPVPAVGLRFILKFFFPSLWMRIQHAGPLAHFTMS